MTHPDQKRSHAKLTLKRESLREMSPQTLREIAGGAVQSIIPTRCGCTGYYPSLNAPCTTSAGDC